MTNLVLSRGLHQELAPRSADGTPSVQQGWLAGFIAESLSPLKHDFSPDSGHSREC